MKKDKILRKGLDILLIGLVVYFVLTRFDFLPKTPTKTKTAAKVTEPIELNSAPIEKLNSQNLMFNFYQIAEVGDLKAFTDYINGAFNLTLVGLNRVPQKFWTNNCADKVDSFNLGFINTFQFGCYTKTKSGENYVAIAKQKGCTESIFVLSKNDVKLERDQLNDNSLGIYRKSIWLKTFLNEPNAIKSQFQVATNSRELLYEKYDQQQIGFIISTGKSYGLNGDNHYISMLLGDINSQAPDEPKLYLNHVQDMKLPCTLMVVNKLDPNFDTEDKRRDFLEKFNGHLKTSELKKLLLIEEPFIAINKVESNFFVKQLEKAMKYNWNSKRRENAFDNNMWE